MPLSAADTAALQATRQRWNQALLDPTWRRTRFNEQPNTLLVAATEALPPGAALDVGMGEGRNALYLAARGWQVTGVDVADQALAFAQARAAQLGLPLTTVTHDLNTYDWGRARWHLLVLCYADEQTHAARAHAALKPGGLVVFENFHADIAAARGLAPGQSLGFATDALPQAYTTAGFRILRYEEPLAVADFSRETQRLVRLVAQKP